MTRVDGGELILDEDTGLILLGEEPFTGVECFRYESGRVSIENTVVGGRKTGPTRAWYESGALKSEGELVADSAEGLFREWHENGRIKREGTFDHSIFTEYRIWDEAGALVEEYRMQPGDPLHQHLELLRRLDAT